MAGQSMPERLMLAELRKELTTCKAPRRRQELELHIIVLLCLIDLKKTLDVVKQLINQREGK